MEEIFYVVWGFLVGRGYCNSDIDPTIAIDRFSKIFNAFSIGVFVISIGFTMYGAYLTHEGKRYADSVGLDYGTKILMCGIVISVASCVLMLITF